MRGIAGEFRWDGGRVPGEGVFPEPGRSGWRSPDGTAAIVRSGPASSGAWIGWHLHAEAGLLLAADVTLYAPDRLRAALGLAAHEGDPGTLLLRAWQRWGEGMLDRLDGDFALVVFDLRQRRAVAMTDPMGLRPLYYRADPARGFAFASSPDALAAWSGQDPRIPESRLLEPLFDAEQLACFEPEMAGVARLAAAQVCTVDAQGVRHRRWWRPGQHDPGLRADDVAGWVEGVRWHLQEAVRKRVADGLRVGVQFSGGLDSSAVLALAHGVGAADRMQAFSVLDRGTPGCPETRAIDALLASTGVPAITVDIAEMQAQATQALQAVAVLPRFVLGRSGFLALFERMAADAGVDVVMNGIDGDLLFFYEDLLERRVRAGDFAGALAQARRQDALGVMPWMEAELRRLRVSSRLPWRLREAVRDVRGWAAVAPRLRNAYLNKTAVARFGLQARMRAYLASLRKPRPPAAGLPTESLHGPITQDGISRFELRARHSGVVMRCPFLDRALVEFAAWIPLELRLRDGHLKWILRKAVEDIMPAAVAWRGDKLHLGSHFDRVMLQPVLERLVRDFAGSGPAVAPYVDREAVLRDARRWQAGELDAVWRLKMLLLLEHWLQHNADKVAFGR